MPKVAESKRSKCVAIAKQYPNEFQTTSNGNLFCKYCTCSVNGKRKSSVNKHRSTAKHKKLSKTKSGTQMFLPKQKDDLIEKVTMAFLSADIPLKKLRNTDIRSMFVFMGQSPPSETACRSRVLVMAENEIQRLAKRLLDKNVFLVADESEVINFLF